MPPRTGGSPLAAEMLDGGAVQPSCAGGHGDRARETDGAAGTPAASVADQVTSGSSAGAAPATFYVAVGGNDIYWRVLSPAETIGANVVQIQAEAAQLLVTHPEHVYKTHQGAGVWTRPDTVRARHAIMMEEYGIRTVAEVDDNYISHPKLNLFMRENRYGREAQKAHLNAMSCFQHVVFSTGWLRDRYHKAFKELRRSHVPELHVCQNHVDWRQRHDPVRRPDGKLRIGWMGSAQHARDIKLAYPALHWAHEQGHEVVLMGHDVRDETGVTHPRALDACRKWRQVIDTHIPWTDPEEYHRTPLPFDIGLAPLEYNDHTMGKSDVKALEYVMSGALPVLQAHPVYTRHWRHLETAVLCGSPVEFRYWIERVCSDGRLREEILANATQYIRENRTMQVQGKAEWERAVGVT